MVGGEQNAGLGDVQSVNKKFLKTSSLLTSDFTAPLDPTGLTSSTHSYDERTTFWALIEDQRRHAHNHAFRSSLQVCFKQSSQVAFGSTSSSDVARMMYASDAVPVAARIAVVASIEVVDERSRSACIPIYLVSM